METVKYNLQDPSNNSYHCITSVNEFDGKLYLGSWEMRGIGVVARRN